MCTYIMLDVVCRVEPKQHGAASLTLHFIHMFNLIE